MLNHLRLSIDAPTVPFILLSLFINLICRFQLLPVDLIKNAQACQLSDMCHTRLFQWPLQQCYLLYRDAKDGEIIVEKKHINGLEINLGCINSTQPQIFNV